MEQRKLIMVVDDEAGNRELLEAILLRLGHDADLCADGDEALRKLSRAHDLILLDVMMPGIDGFEVARRIRCDSEAPDVPICMVTALTDKKERLKAVEAGASDFISKPIDTTELQVRMNSLLKIKEGQDVIRHYHAKLEAQNYLLEENVAQLQKLNEQKDEFLGIASHDLKNPLMCVLGFASVIGQLAPPGAVMTEQTNDFLTRIKTQCRTMQKIIEDYLDFQALEDGQMLMLLEPVDLNDLVGEVIEHHAGYAETKRTLLHRELNAAPSIVSGDKGRLKQVLGNYVSNAIKFSPPGEDVTILTRRSEGGILVEVKDAGPGLSADDMQKLFVKYARLGNAPTGGEKSSGLGLAISKKLIKMLGGTTGARNNEDRGATFWFDVPAHASPQGEMTVVMDGAERGTGG